MHNYSLVRQIVTFKQHLLHICLYQVPWRVFFRVSTRYESYVYSTFLCTKERRLGGLCLSQRVEAAHPRALCEQLWGGTLLKGASALLWRSSLMLCPHWVLNTGRPLWGFKGKRCCDATHDRPIRWRLLMLTGIDESPGLPRQRKKFPSSGEAISFIPEGTLSYP